MRNDFFQSDQFRTNKRFSDYISKLRLNNNHNGTIVLSFKQEVSISSFIYHMHLTTKEYFLKYEDVEVLLRAACKDCVISNHSADDIMSYLSAAYVNLAS